MKKKTPKNIAVDKKWITRHKDRVTTAEEAVAHIKSGQRVFVGTGCAQPSALIKALIAQSGDLADVEIVHFLTVGDAPYAKSKLAEQFNINTFYVSDNVRDCIQEGLGAYTPASLSDIPKLLGSGQMPIDVALIQVTPPDDKGVCSLGISVDIVKSASENAALVIAQVNPNMPRTMGNSRISVYDIDLLVPVDDPLAEYKLPAPDEATRQIGQLLSALVENGSTVELGIGAIPQATAAFLKGKKNLGIHTEMVTDSIIDLMESGAVNGTRKKLDPGKVVASFCMGTKKLYDYVDSNPAFAFHPSEYVNDLHIIGQQHRQIAINTALEVDLTGQVCADSMGTRFLAGIGGQADFSRGALRSKGGKAIIALPSTADGKSLSRIVTRLSHGAGVTTTRAEVHYIVTEHGTAYLHGKNIEERALTLISIADPKFREQLLKEAIEAKYIRPEFQDMEGKLTIAPPEYRSTMILNDGTELVLRSILPTDIPATRDLFYALSQETIYYRFRSRMKYIPSKEIRNSVFVKHGKDVSLVVTLPNGNRESILAIGRYYLDEKTNFAEVAFVVHDDWQSKGIGSFMLKQLIIIARHNGIYGFTAEVLAANRAMQIVFNKSGQKVTSKPHDDVISYKLEFS